MYGRKYGDKELRFEASGGLLHSSLVMQDKETDSYWSIMTGDSLAGELRGTPLDELPLGRKATWGDWRKEHPGTLVLSVGGAEHVENNPYDNYFTSEEGFRGAQATDDRLSTKTPIFAFQLEGLAYAVPFSGFTGGRAISLGERSIFLYRAPDAPIFASTLAYVAGADGFESSDAGWKHRASGAVFSPRLGGFSGTGAERIKALDGFDTFWFNWSMTHPGTKILGSMPKSSSKTE